MSIFSRLRMKRERANQGALGRYADLVRKAANKGDLSDPELEELERLGRTLGVDAEADVRALGTVADLQAKAATAKAAGEAMKAAEAALEAGYQRAAAAQDEIPPLQQANDSAIARYLEATKAEIELGNLKSQRPYLFNGAPVRKHVNAGPAFIEETMLQAEQLALGDGSTGDPTQAPFDERVVALAMARWRRGIEAADVPAFEIDASVAAQREHFRTWQKNRGSKPAAA